VKKDGGLELLRSQGKRVALRFAFRVKPHDRFVVKNVKVVPTTKGEDGFGVRGHQQIANPVPFTTAKTASR
jgi:hypothetical protein